MRSGHRAAHLKVLAACIVLAGAALAYGWVGRTARPVPKPVGPDIAVPGPAPGTEGFARRAPAAARIPGEGS